MPTSNGRTIASFAFLLCVFALTPFAVQAQNDVQVTISVLPPYSAYLQDYAGAGKQVQIFVRNTTANRLNVRLQGSVTGDNGVTIQTVPNHRPPQPLTLEPLQNRLLSYADLSGLFDLGQIDVQGFDRNNLYKGLPLPEGTYQLCIRAFDNATSRPLSPENPLGCSPPFPVKAVEPPILIAPLCDNEIQPMTPQNIVFTWTPPVGVSPASIDYTLRIVELPLDNADPNVFIDAIVLPKSGVEVKNLKTSTFLYSVVHPPLIPGKRYAWRVQARDLSGRTNFLNDGKSPVCAFQYGPPVVNVRDVVAPVSIGGLAFLHMPNCATPGKNNLGAGANNDLTLNWQMDSKLRESVAKAMGVASVPNALSALANSDLAYQFSIIQGKKTLVLRTQKEPRFAIPVTEEFPLTFGQTYQTSVALVGLTDAQRKAMGLTKGQEIRETCGFRLVRVDKKIPNETTIAGTVLFRYPGDTKTYPLTNTRVRLQYVPTQSVAQAQATNSGPQGGGVGGASPVPKTGSSKSAPAKPGSNKPGNSAANKTANPGPGNVPTNEPSAGYVLNGAPVALGATVLTDEQGKYALKVEDYLKLLGTDTSAKTPPPGYLQLVVESPYVEQPADQLPIGLQKQIQLPDQLVMARSYRLTISARKTFDKKNWPTLEDRKLDGQLVIIYRKPHPTKGLKHLPPVEGLAERFFKQTDVANPGNLLADAAGKAGGLSGANVPKGLGGVSNKTEPTSESSTTTYLPMTLNEPDPIYGAVADAVIVSEEEAKADLKKAKLAYVASGTLKVLGDKATVQVGRLLYAASPHDTYYAYCPNLGQTATGGTAFSFQLPSNVKMEATAPRSETLDMAISANQPPRAQFAGRLLYQFADPTEAGKVKPLANTRVKLVVAYVIGNGTVDDKPVPGFVAINGETFATSGYTDNLKTLATTVTDAQGNFAFGAALDKPYKLGLLNPSFVGEFIEGYGEFRFKHSTKGKLYRTLRVIVDNPYYASPSGDYGESGNEGGDIKPFSSNSMGDLMAVAQSYKLTIKAISNLSANQAAGTNNDLTGVDVYVLRKEKPVSKGGVNLIPPSDEGQNLGKEIKTGNGKSYWIVAKGRTADQGLVSFTKMIREDGVPNIDDYIMAGISNITSINNTQDLIADLTNDAPIEPVGINLSIGQKPGSLIGSAALPIFANEYVYDEFLTTKQFKPGLPRITVRAINANNPQQGIAGARVKLKYQLAGKWQDHGFTTPIYTDSAGYYTWQLGTIQALLMQASPAKSITNVKLYIGGKPGYFYQDSLGNQSYYAVFDLKTMLMGTNYYNEKVLLQPDGVLAGRLVLEGSNGQTGVKGQVQGGANGPVVATDAKGYFNLRVPSAKTDSAFVFPDNKIYFEERLKLAAFQSIKNVDFLKVNDLKNVTIYERDHRVMFRVTRYPVPPYVPGSMTPQQYQATILAPALVPGVTVTVFGEEFKPGADGYVRVRFKNASISNLSMTVSALGFISRTIAMPKNEESREFKVVKDVVLKAAKAITGTVALYKDGAPASANPTSQTASGTIKLPGGVPGGLKGAELYVIEGKGASSLTAVSGFGGMFTLYVPEDMEKATVRVAYADKSTTTYEGMTATAEPNKPLNLTVTVFDKFDLKTIYGFPVKLTDISEKGKVTTVSGEVVLSQDVFRPIDPTVKLTFKDVAVKVNEQGKAEPVDGMLGLGLAMLETAYYGGGGSQKTPDYNVKLIGTSFKSQLQTQLAITPREGSGGWIRVKAQVVDNSFKFPSSLLSYEQGQFHLFDPTDKNRKEGDVPIITAFVPNGYSGVIRYPYGLCKADGSALQFKFLGFEATSKPDKSRLSGSEIWIGPDIQCNIPNAQPAKFTVSVDKIVLKNNTIDPQTGKEPLVMPLGGNWKLSVPNWKLDYKEGGFFAENSGKVVTGKVDLPLKTFNLRHNLFVKKVDTENLKTISLAGITTLNLGGKAYFDYDTRTGSDQAGHWTVVFAPSQPGGSAATIDKTGLPGLSSNLVFETFSLLDNGEDILSFAPSVKAVKLYNLVDFMPRSIETGPNYFAIGGSMSTQIPRVQKDMPAQMRYSKPNNGPVALNLTMPTPIQFEAPGYVQFKNSIDQKKMPDIQLKESLMVLRGTVEEPGELEPIKVLLVHTPTATRLVNDLQYGSLNDLTDPTKLPGTLKPIAQKIPITGDSKYFDQVRCQMDVANNDWGLLNFSGELAGVEGVTKNRLEFTVHGEIVANDQEVGVKDVKLGGAKFSLVYDRKKSHITGTAILPGFPMDGGMSFEGGAAQYRLGTSGFYLATSGSIKDVPVIVPVTVKAGMMVGYYDSRDFTDAEPIVFMFSHKKQFPCAFNDNFKGFFLIGEVPVPGLDGFRKSYEFGIGSAHIGVDAYVDSYFFGRYGGGANIAFGGGTSANVRAFAKASVLGGLLKVGGELSLAAANSNKYAVEGVKLSMAAAMQASAELKAWGSLYNPFGDDFKEDFTLGFCFNMGCSLVVDDFTKPFKLPGINPKIGFQLNKCDSGCQ